MKNLLFMLVVSASLLLGGCAPSYKTSQTPDDVYSSTAPPKDDYAKVKKQDERRYRHYDDADDQYDDEYEDYDNRYLRMKVQNRYMWSDLDDWYYYGGRYNYSYYNNWAYWNDPFYWNNPWTPVGYWNWYNPYWGGSWGWGYGMSIGFGGFYNSWYGGFYGDPYFCGWGGWYSPWYSGWYGNPYYYGWGGWYAGSVRTANYGPRFVNPGNYNRNTVTRGSGAAFNSGRGGISVNNNGNSFLGRGYRSTYGVRTDASVSTSQVNSSSQSRANSLRERFGTAPSNGNNSGRGFSRTETYNPRSDTYRPSTPSFDGGSRGGSSSSGSSGGGSGRGGSSGGGSGRGRF